MIAAVIVILALYLAIRLTLSESSQRIRKFQKLWDDHIRCKPVISETDRAAVQLSVDASKTRNGLKPTLRIRDSENRHHTEEYQQLLQQQLQQQQHVPSQLPRRRTGAVNGRTPFKRPQQAKGISRILMRLPFMDAGNWLQGQVKNGYNSNYLSHNSNLRTLLPEEYCPRTVPENKTLGFSSVPGNDHTLNMFKVPTENRDGNIFTRFFQHIYFIVQRDSSMNYPDVSEKVMASERVKTAVKNAVMQDLRGQVANDSLLVMSHLSHKKRAQEVLLNMKSCISSFLLKIAAWVMYKLLGRMLDGIEVHREQIENIRRASKNSVPIIYLPLHRSHLDYILVTFILYMNDLRAPLVAAGNNLMIPFFGALLRGLGAFFIKRKLDPQKGKRDYVYRAILHTYMEESLREGHSLEFFIEGGRSRTGKAVLPKAGLLSIVVDTLLSGGINDAYIVPIAMSYEKLLDGNFVSEQMGKPKVMESFSSAVKAIWRTLHSNFGTVRVDFCQPFSLKEFLLAAEYSYNLPKNIQSCALRQNLCIFNHNVKPRRRSEYGTEVVLEDHRQVIKDLADYIVYDAFNANALMSTNLVAFLFVTKHRKGTTLQQLVSSLNWLREEVTKRNKTINFAGDSTEMVKRACQLLGKQLVNMETIQMEWSSGNTDNNNMKIIFYKPSVSLPEVLELQYYANAVLPVFLLESIIINTFYALHGDESDKVANKEHRSTVVRASLLKQALELCSILQYEFIFSPPGTSLCSVLNATVDDLISSGFIEVVDMCMSSKVKNVRMPFHEFSSGPEAIVVENNISVLEVEEWDSISLSPTPLISDGPVGDNFQIEEESESMYQRIKLTADDEHHSMLQFLRCILSPLVESYWLVSCALPKLINSELDEATFFHEVKRLGQKKIHLGQLYYEECLGLDTLKNSLKLLDTWKVLSSKTVNSRNSIYSLHSCYNSESALKDVIARIEKYKK